MAGTLHALFPQSTITGTSTHRFRCCFPPPKHFQFSALKRVATYHIWKCHSVAGTRIMVTKGQFRQGTGDGKSYIPHVSSSKWIKPIMKFATDNFLPLALISGVIVGLVNPSFGSLADRYYLSKVSTFGIFIISGLTLRSDEIGAAAEAWPVGLFGLVSILFLTPLFSNIILLLKLQPQEFITGLAIFSCMPTTLSSGVALTKLAGGNSALALAMTVISNLLGILIIPFSISKFIASGVGVSVPTEQLLRSLVLTLLFPLVLGKGVGDFGRCMEFTISACHVARDFSKKVADFADGNRQFLSMSSAILLSLVPWMQVSRSRSLLLMVKPEIFLVAVMLGALLHAALFVFNALAVQAFSLVSDSKSAFAKKENVSALLLVASQKTLPVMVAVAEQLGGSLGESGLLVLPCVAAHLNQIIIDSFLVSFWKQKENTIGNAKVA